ncbi:uncharacterized protein PgNI_02299 [Pyricularia grisea]|uniref:Uncharacterized protein n=1 Tax=Pyricularia grisea TaxID=148305 RepID=A0A6P8BK13_PYRGI|nr:uncharacterized protein PgNI_02299 [Pyricularia grisea]TLD17015.1 hypothetical protein PgNI_02299 [Pyricularia grisea]
MLGIASLILTKMKCESAERRDKMPSKSQPLPPLGVDGQAISNGPAVPPHPLLTAIIVGYGGASGPVAVLTCIGDAIEILAGRQVARQEGWILVPRRMVRQWRLVGARWAVHLFFFCLVFGWISVEKQKSNQWVLRTICRSGPYAFVLNPYNVVLCFFLLFFSSKPRSGLALC